jgi:hypothetical protein
MERGGTILGGCIWSGPADFSHSFSFNLCSGICQRQHTVQIPVFWGHLDSLLRGTDPDPFINKQNSKKTFISTVL